MGSRQLLRCSNTGKGGGGAGDTPIFCLALLQLLNSPGRWGSRGELRPRQAHAYIGHKPTLVDGEQWEGHRPIRTQPKSTARYVPRAPHSVLNTIDEARQDQLSARAMGAIQTRNRVADQGRGFSRQNSDTALRSNMSGRRYQVFFFFCNPKKEIPGKYRSTQLRLRKPAATKIVSFFLSVIRLPSH